MENDGNVKPHVWVAAFIPGQSEKARAEFCLVLDALGELLDHVAIGTATILDFGGVGGDDAAVTKLIDDDVVDLVITVPESFEARGDAERISRIFEVNCRRNVKTTELINLYNDGNSDGIPERADIFLRQNVPCFNLKVDANDQIELELAAQSLKSSVCAIMRDRR